MTLALVVVAVLGLAAVGTGLLRRYALARQVLDVPNARSSHTVPTPRGGGAAMVVAFFLGLAALVLTGRVDGRVALALGGAGGLVALVGLLDDHRPLPARWRLLAHFASAAWLLWWLGGLPDVPVLGRSWALGPAGDALGVVALVWLLNLYNFMDGIDGIAGVEALSVGLGAALVYGVSNPAVDSALPVLLAASATGFLLWNFPRARIFMGDAGSGFLGITLGGLAIAGALRAPLLLWSWVLLLGVFVVDSTVTLLQRLRRRARVFEAHRSHAYQHAAQRSGRHAPVTLAVLAINVCWLLPWAWAVAVGRVDPAIALLVAYAPLVAAAHWLRAGLDAGRIRA